MVSGAQSGDLGGRVGEDGLLPELIVPGRGCGCSRYREHDVQRHTQARQRTVRSWRTIEIVSQEHLSQALDKPMNSSIKANV